MFRCIGNETTAEGKRVVTEFGNLLGQPLPLPGMPDLTIVRTRLVAEFPHATAVVDVILRKLAARRHLHLRPTILLGSPGGGKSRFARRLLEELGLPYEMVACGGIGDSFIGGTARRWTTGEPSIAVMAVRRHGCAGPAIVLDEIEKVATSRHNGNVHDVLVGLLEPETALRWFDPYVEAHCDLSHGSWLMTANAVESIPAVLRDRCRILRFPQPGPDQLTALATRILERLYVELGHDPRWATPLDQVEIDALSAAWPGGSIRALHRRRSITVAAGNSSQGFTKVPERKKGRPMTQSTNHTGSPADQCLHNGIPSLRSLLLRLRLAVHQAAHAVGWLHLGLGTIEKITIEPPEGGLVAGNRNGFGEMTQELLATMLVSTLIGRAAEQEILGSVAAYGVAETHNDVDLASEFAFVMEATPDFARKWPRLYRPKANRTLLLALDRDLRDLVNARLDTAYDTARELVVRQQAAIEFLAGILLARQTLEGPELERLFEELKQHMAS